MPYLTREQHEEFDSRYNALALAYTDSKIEFPEFVRSVKALDDEAAETAARNLRISAVFAAESIEERIDAAAALTEDDWQVIASTTITARQIEEVAEQ